MGLVYHGSANGGLETIQPRKSTHGKEYVYAARHRAIALLFLCRWNDFLLTLETSGSGKNLRIALTERYENALTDIFSKKQGFLCTLRDEGFFALDNGWEHEVVCESAKTPLRCEAINDVELAIKALEGLGILRVFRYPSRPGHIPQDDSDMLQKAVELYELSGDAYNAKYCAKRFPHLENEIKERFLKLFNVDIDEVL